jgi:hypothetical protein
VDPNPKESESFCWIRIRIRKKSSDSDPDTVVEWEILWKIEDKTLEKEKTNIFLLKNLFSNVQVPEHKQLEEPNRKNLGKKY